MQASSNSRHRRPLSPRALLRAGFALTSLFAAFAIATGACSSDNDNPTTTSTTTTSTTSTGTGCVGGVETDAGCEGKCDPAICNSNGVTGNVCQNNQCALTCTSHLDCLPDGSQSCVAGKDDTGADVFTCQSNGRAPGFGVACPFGNECDALKACPDGSPCDPANCDASACVPFLCHTLGQGDADAYCTLENCTADSDCGGGFYCGEHHAINSDGSTEPTVCGATPATPTFIQACATAAPASQCVMPGEGFSQGQYCTEQTICLKRDECSACASDLDCSLQDGESCQMVGDSKRCVAACAKDTDCHRDKKCTGGFCEPRYVDGCTAKTPGYCTPCVDDRDCGDATSHFQCLEVDSLSHERACFDLSKLADCKTQNDCPKAPGGKHGQCIDENYGFGLTTCTGPKKCGNDAACGTATSGTVCDDTTKLCVAGCRGSGGNACNGTLTCSSNDTTQGTCGTCAVDTDCGTINSGAVCDDTLHTCVSGCRGTGGNKCAAGLTCSSTTATEGHCLECGGSGEVCDDTTHVCSAGCRGVGLTSVCPNALTCSSTDNNVGSCSTCASDSDCGGATSGAVCDDMTHICKAGCRGTGGNGCDANAGYTTCTSIDNSVGECLQCGGGNLFCYHTCLWPGSVDTFTSCW